LSQDPAWDLLEVMEAVEERRAASREDAECDLYIHIGADSGAWRIIGKLTNVSPDGLCFRSRRHWPEGAIVWCAVPAQLIYTRAQIVHSSGRFWRWRSGLRFLANRWSD